VLLLERLSHEPQEAVFYEIMSRETLRLTRAAPVPGKFALIECHRLLGFSQGLTEIVAMLVLECTPNI
jgi:hypothetical protein